MRTLPAASSLLAVLLVTALAAPTAVADHDATEPVYAGTVTEGESVLHHHNGGESCGRTTTSTASSPIILYYGIFVVLEYATAADTISLSAAGTTVQGQGGLAVIQFDSAWGACTGMDIVVTGVDVAAVTPYTLQVYVVPGYFFDHSEGPCMPPVDVDPCYDETEEDVYNLDDFILGLDDMVLDRISAFPCGEHGGVDSILELLLGMCDDGKGPKN